MKNLFKIAFVIIGTLIGAGFASGKEIYIFFFCYGLKGLIGIAISSTIIGIISYCTLYIVKHYNCKNYKELIDVLIRNKKIKDIVNAFINTFILVTFYIMVAGFGAYLNQEFKINSIFASGILAILCMIVFKSEVNGFVKVNEFLIPILILVIITIGIINIYNIDIKNMQNHIIQENYQNWILSSILYASYNSILLIPVLITIKDYINKNHIKYAVIIPTIMVMILAIIIFTFLINIDINIKQLEMPAVYAVKNIINKADIIYGIIILMSIFTTAISLGTSLLGNISKNNKSYKLISTIMCISSIIFSQIGFSNLVNLLYPIFGLLGLIQIIQILTKYIAKKSKN